MESVLYPSAPAEPLAQLLPALMKLATRQALHSLYFEIKNWSDSVLYKVVFFVADWVPSRDGVCSHFSAVDNFVSRLHPRSAVILHRGKVWSFGVVRLDSVLTPCCVTIADLEFVLLIDFDVPVPLVHDFTFVFVISRTKAYTFLVAIKLTDHEFVLSETPTYVVRHSVNELVFFVLFEDSIFLCPKDKLHSIFFWDDELKEEYPVLAPLFESQKRLIYR